MKAKLLAAAILAAVSSIMACPASAAILAQDIAGTDPGATGFFGQSVTTPGGGPFNNIKFNFYSLEGATLAPGTLYVFSSAYAGTPGNLSTAGALASSVGAGGIYTFAPAITLSGGTQYFFYESVSMTPLGQVTGTYPGGNVFFSSGSAYFNATASDADFTLQGTPVPEPLTLSLFGVGIGGLALIHWKRKKQAPVRPRR